jgi:hypothetical protein
LLLLLLLRLLPDRTLTVTTPRLPLPHTCTHAQALLEFHLFPPPLPPAGLPAVLRLFAAFWVAGVPRMGEAGARGWAYWCCWHAMGMEQPQQQPEQQEEEEQEQQQQQQVGWQASALKLSARKRHTW